jgi:membrane protein DedA with SNARE-associated domain
LLLVAIGFLCGRNWKSRLLWALGVLFVTSLILVMVVAVARTFVPDRIVDRPEGSDATQVGIVVADKADEIVGNAINTLVSGLEVKLILFIVFSGLAIAGVIAWAIVDRRRRQRLTQYDPDSPPA